MKKLLVLTNSILEYRIPVYTELSKYYELTVAYYETSKVKNEYSFSQLKLSKFDIGPICFIKENLLNICSKFELCLVMGDMHVFSYMRLGFIRRRNFSLTFWGGDVSFSYKKKYDEDRRFDKIRFYLMNRADSIVFYCSYPIKRYVNDGKIDRKKLFVATNTVYIPNKISVPSKKKYFLFVGTLYKAKKVYYLLSAYLISYKFNNDLQPLIIIGDGAEKINIVKWIDDNFLQEKIFVKDGIYENSLLEPIFKDAICCISPGQAGLSVLSSLAYGVPFVTSKNAITGGEIFNIINNFNGILYNGSIYELSYIINELSKNEEKVFNLSKNAQTYYFENTTINNMVAGLCDSIEYAFKVHNRKCI